jgi:hypothetical protein
MIKACGDKLINAFSDKTVKACGDKLINFIHLLNLQ